MNGEQLEGQTILAEAEASGAPTSKRVLNVGSGPAFPSRLHACFQRAGWDEIRLDIDPRVEPQLVGTMVDMRNLVPDDSFDAIWSSHNIEHLYAHEVSPALTEFNRILSDTGFALITCPDLDAICRAVVSNGIEEVAYVSPAGPIAPLDMLFGHSRSIEFGNQFMAHNTGFTAKRLGRVILQAGFAEVRVAVGSSYDLWALALMPNADRAQIAQVLAGTNQATLAADEATEAQA